MSSSLYRRLHGLFLKPKTTVSSKPTTISAKPTTSTTVSNPKTPESTTATTTTSSKEKRLKLLVKKFKKASNSPSFRLRISQYETTVQRLAKAKQFSLISDILEHQKQYSDITDERFIVRLISLYGKSGMFDQAQNLFDEMPQLKCDRTVMSFNALLAACVNSKKFDKISEFFRELPEKLSFEPDRVSYNTVIKAFCEMGSLDSAVVVIDEMEKNGIEPNFISFNTLIDAFYKSNQISDAEKMWEKMEQKNVVPNVRCYNPKLRWLVGDNRILEAVELIEEMEKKGVKPDIFSFKALIKGFCDDGNMEEAKKWYGKIVENDCVPDRVTFMTLIPFVCNKGDYQFGLELCKEALNRRCLVDTTIMQRMVDELVKESMVEEAKELVELGKSNRFFHYNLKFPKDE
ncbi:unnamed protein product [Ilex paraguariensis]|uniref:Pentatricopeptide repeat-containing protein n=1 Tax=Ilex paraguariensis TaxID=185542 RepID=A0ABC8QXQ1_9AQUA